MSDEERKARIAATFERAREKRTEDLVPTQLFRAGRRLRGECPFCGHGKSKRAGGPFWVDPSSGAWGCFSCPNAGRSEGDVIAFERKLRGGTPLEAAERLAGATLPLTPRLKAEADPKPEGPAPDPAKLKFCDRLWREARPAGGSPVEHYLRGRGLDGWVLKIALEHLRFHPAAFWGDGNAYPAMIAGLRAPAGATGGMHVTYLRNTDEGWTKARVDPAKRMFGPQGLDGSPGGVWLTSVTGPGPLLVGEGIESTLSAAVLLGRPCRMVATLSLRALQGGWMADRFGRLSVDMPVADPEQPAFTWPELETAPWGEVLIAVDRDMKPITVRVRRVGGGTVERRIGAEDRARLCGSLASQAWHRAMANPVRVIAPAAGRDFNDELLAKRAEGWAA